MSKTSVTRTILVMALSAVAALFLVGCNADCASPFEAPDATTQPVTCADTGCAQ